MMLRMVLRAWRYLASLLTPFNYGVRAPWIVIVLLLDVSPWTDPGFYGLPWMALKLRKKCARFVGKTWVSLSGPHIDMQARLGSADIMSVTSQTGGMPEQYLRSYCMPERGFLGTETECS